MKSCFDSEEIKIETECDTKSKKGGIIQLRTIVNLPHDIVDTKTIEFL